METFPAHLKTKFGYTMVELAVVIGVAGVLLTMGLYGYRGFEYKAQLRGAQRALMNHLLMARNEALSGVMLSGMTEPVHYARISNAGTTYAVDGNSYELGQNVELAGLSKGSIIDLYFFHPAKEECLSPQLYDQCCYFACGSGLGPIASGPLDITLRHQHTGETACIRIEGRDLRINRIYEITCP